MAKFHERSLAKFVAELRVPAGKREIQVFDDGLPGFGIRKFASGKASYVVKYTAGRQQRKLSLGPVIPCTLTTQRKLASETLSRVRLGQDPGDKRAGKAKAARLAPDVGPLVTSSRGARDRSTADLALGVDPLSATRPVPVAPLALEFIRRADIVPVIDQVSTHTPPRTALGRH